MPWSLNNHNHHFEECQTKKKKTKKHALVTPKHPLPLLGLTTHGKPHCFCTLQKRDRLNANHKNVLCKRDWSNANHKKYVVLSNKKFVITCRKTPRLPACLPRSGSTSQLEGPPPAMFHYCNKYFYLCNCYLRHLYFF